MVVGNGGDRFWWWLVIMLIVVAAWSSTPVQDLVGSGGDGCDGCTVHLQLTFRKQEREEKT